MPRRREGSRCRSWGNQALGVDPELYDICWPIKNGMLDGTRPIRIVYSDLYDIWWSLIKNQLKLSKADVTVRRFVSAARLSRHATPLIAM